MSHPHRHPESGNGHNGRHARFDEPASVHGVDERLLIDLIEDQPLSAEARETLGRALLADHNLSRLVAQMRADRAGLLDLGSVKAPAGLIDGVEAMLERDALLGLAASESVAAPASIPISTFRAAPALATTRRPSMRRIGFALSAAAALAVVATVSYFAASRSGPNRPKPTDLTHNADPAPNIVPPRDLPGPSPIVNTLATGNDPAAAPIGTPEPALATAIAAVSTIDDLPKDIAPAPADPFGMSFDRAIALARDGRLVVRVRTAAIDAVTANLERALDKPVRSGRLVTLPGPVAATLASALHRDLEALPPIFTTAPRPGESPAIANQDPEHPANHIPVARPGETFPIVAPVFGPTIFALAMPADEATLRALLRMLGGTGDVRLELSESPAHLPAALPVDAASVFWWTTPATWSPTLSVPVVVQSR
ncbi:MAG: hypothetical protein ACT4PL_14875 [Phycisphaerales bacterium]